MSELDIRLGAPVITADQHQAGKVDRVVIEPSSQHVSDIIVHKGGLLTRDVVVPADCIEQASPRAVHLRLRADELDALPDFVETAFVPLESRDVSPLITWEGPPDWEPHPVMVPAATLYNPPVMPFAPQIVEEWENIPAGAAAIPEGSPVTCADGILGAVAEVQVDPVSDQAVAVVVRINDHRWLVPLDQVEVRGDGGLHLRLRHCELQPYDES